MTISQPLLKNTGLLTWQFFCLKSLFKMYVFPGIFILFALCLISANAQSHDQCKLLQLFEKPQYCELELPKVEPMSEPATGPTFDVNALVEEFFTFPKDKEISNQQSHTNNWAVLVCSSRFWFNYRHVANVLSVYRTVKRLGIPDSNIILMLADDIACNSRNKFPGTIFNNADRRLDLYGGMSDGTVEVDYRGYEVTVESLIQVLTGRQEEYVPKSKRLLSNEQSQLLVYLTGHGGDEFLKFQDNHEISSQDIADAFHQMNEKKRYKEILFMIDTCQANTLYNRFYSPNIVAVGSSEKDENSYSHHQSSIIGVAVIDRFTYYMLDFLEKNVKSISSTALLRQLFDSLNPSSLLSHHRVRKDLLKDRKYNDLLISDFYGHVQPFEITEVRYELPETLLSSEPTVWYEDTHELPETHFEDDIDQIPADSLLNDIQAAIGIFRTIRRTISQYVSPKDHFQASPSCFAISKDHWNFRSLVFLALLTPIPAIIFSTTLISSSR